LSISKLIVKRRCIFNFQDGFAVDGCNYVPNIELVRWLRHTEFTIDSVLSDGKVLVASGNLDVLWFDFYFDAP